MKINKKTKYLLFFLAFFLCIGLIFGLTLSRKETTKKNKFGYDLGLTTAPLNSLNYVLYKSVDVVSPSLVDTVYKNGPAPTIQALFGKTPINFGVYGTNNNATSLEKYLNSSDLDAKNYISDYSYAFSDFGFGIGTGAFENLSAQPGRALFTPNNRVITFTVTLNDGKSRWSNGQKTIADDYVDYVRYLGDLNTGSQKQLNLLRQNIKGLNDFVLAQNEYLSRFKTTYKNPWGYPGYEKKGSDYIYKIDQKNKNGQFLDNDYLWPSQNPGDEETVAKIRQAALKVGFYTGRLYFNISNKDLFNLFLLEQNQKVDLTGDVVVLKNEQNQDVVLRKNPYVDPLQVYNLASLTTKIQNNEQARKIANYVLFARDENEFRVEYEQSSPKDLSGLLNNLTTTFLPVNRSFIENQLGGIQNFGKNIDSIVTNGPFQIEKLILGAQGNMVLKKNLSYYNVNNVIPNEIKIFFNDDKNLGSAMFSDGYIAYSVVPSIEQRKFWASKNNRNLMSKIAGFGTLGFMFNLDYETNRNSWIQDQDLRNAFYYAINRQTMLFNSGWNNSYPVITWTAFGTAHKSEGTAIEFGFQDKFTQPKGIYSEKKLIPLQNYTYANHLSKDYKFEANNRLDLAFDPGIAKHYLNIFKAKHPEIKTVKLRYVYNSTEEQKNVGLALKNNLQTLFGDFIDLELKALPQNVYVSKIEEGDFDVAYKNFDAFGREIDSYIKTFFGEDGIDKQKEKNTGFNLNPSGGFTYTKYFANLESSYDLIDGKLVKENEKLVQKRLQIDDFVWEKLKDLSQKKAGETESQHKERIARFFSYQFDEKEIQEGYDENKVIAVVAGFEKIIRDAVPVIPLMEVDTNWVISRVGGVNNLYTFDLQYAYDIARPPILTLPRTVFS